uniref:KH domain-containing protein n=1 Tax=Schistosoma curassoni TaxID=6186 RepID=A0A183KVL1_9TREM
LILLSEFHSVSGILVITGVQERINQVFEEGIKPLLPIEETFPVPQEFHRNLIVTSSDTTTREQSRRSLRGNNNSNSNKRNNNVSEQVTNTTAETLSKAMEIKQKHSVNIRLPPQHTSGSDYISLRGTPANIEAAKADLTEWLQQCELIKADKIARSYETVVEFPFRFLSSILSMRADLCSKHDVGIRVDTGSSSSNSSSSVVLKTLPPSLSSMPEHSSVDNNTTDISDDITFCSISKPIVEDNSNNDNESDELSSTGLPKEKQAKIILRGYQENVSAAKIELENTINKLLAEVTENLFIPVETHARLIGARGNAIQKVMRDYNVRIEFPSRRNINSANGDGNTVLVTGAPENVDQACDYLISKANEFLNKLSEINQSYAT